MADEPQQVQRYQVRAFSPYNFTEYGVYDTQRQAWMPDHLGWREYRTIYLAHAVHLAELLNAIPAATVALAQ